VIALTVAGESSLLKYNIKKVLQRSFGCCVPTLVVSLESLHTDGSCIRSGIVKDPSGRMSATLHGSVFDMFPSSITPGCVLVLSKVRSTPFSSMFREMSQRVVTMMQAGVHRSKYDHVLIITDLCVVSVIRTDESLPRDTQVRVRSGPIVLSYCPNRYRKWIPRPYVTSTRPSFPFQLASWSPNLTPSAISLLLPLLPKNI
jgi:hypothetical protein